MHVRVNITIQRVRNIRCKQQRIYFVLRLLYITIVLLIEQIVLNTSRSMRCIRLAVE